MNTEKSIAHKIAERLSTTDEYRATAELIVKEELKPMIEIMEKVLVNIPSYVWTYEEFSAFDEFINQNKI